MTGFWCAEAAALGLSASVVDIAQRAAGHDKTIRISGDPVLLIPKLKALA